MLESFGAVAEGHVRPLVETLDTLERRIKRQRAQLQDLGRRLDRHAQRIPEESMGQDRDMFVPAGIEYKGWCSGKPTRLAG